jgi:hypothetical protein
MRTPAGTECSYFYGDYYRGRNHEECRLLGPADWKPDLCRNCPVPEIQQANVCQHMVLRGEIYRPLLIGKRAVRVTAYCRKSQTPVAEPHIGCGDCHLLPPIFTGDSHRDPHASA